MGFLCFGKKPKRPLNPSPPARAPQVSAPMSSVELPKIEKTTPPSEDQRMEPFVRNRSCSIDDVNPNVAPVKVNPKPAPQTVNPKPAPVKARGGGYGAGGGGSNSSGYNGSVAATTYVSSYSGGGGGGDSGGGGGGDSGGGGGGGGGGCD